MVISKKKRSSLWIDSYFCIFFRKSWWSLKKKVSCYRNTRSIQSEKSSAGRTLDNPAQISLFSKCLATHLETFHDILVRRDTQIGKHCFMELALDFVLYTTFQFYFKKAIRWTVLYKKCSKSVVLKLFRVFRSVTPTQKVLNIRDTKKWFLLL